MMKLILVITVFLVTSVSRASEHQVIDTLGTSKKGQFVALEQYGYRSHDHIYYVKIQIMNVWTEEYVGKSFEVETPAYRREDLAKARLKARSDANDELLKFEIKG